jgi:hypothetical protein
MQNCGGCNHGRSLVKPGETMTTQNWGIITPKNKLKLLNSHFHDISLSTSSDKNINVTPSKFP